MKKRALIISISIYQESEYFPQLKKATQDAEGLAAILRNKDCGDFDTVEVLSNTTKAIVNQTVTKFYKTAEEDDLLLLYFCGHCTQKPNGELYLTFADTRYKALETTSLSLAKIGTIMNASCNKNQLVILDCFFDADKRELPAMQNIHGGSLSLQAGWQLAPTKNRQLDNSPPPNRIVLSACDKMTAASSRHRTQSDGVFSLYMETLIDGFGKARAQDAKGNITANSLHQYARQEVESKSQGTQNPQIIFFANSKDLILVKNKLLGLPAEIAALLNNEQANLRLAGITQLKFLCRNQSHLIPAAKQALHQLSRNRNVFVQGEATEVLQGLLELYKGSNQQQITAQSGQIAAPLELSTAPEDLSKPKNQKQKAWITTASLLAIAITLNWWLMAKQGKGERHQTQKIENQAKAAALTHPSE